MEWKEETSDIRKKEQYNKELDTSSLKDIKNSENNNNAFFIEHNSNDENINNNINNYDNNEEFNNVNIKSMNNTPYTEPNQIKYRNSNYKIEENNRFSQYNALADSQEVNSNNINDSKNMNSKEGFEEENNINCYDNDNNSYISVKKINIIKEEENLKKNSNNKNFTILINKNFKKNINETIKGKNRINNDYDNNLDEKETLRRQSIESNYEVEYDKDFINKEDILNSFQSKINSFYQNDIDNKDKSTNNKKRTYNGLFNKNTADEKQNNNFEDLLKNSNNFKIDNNNNAKAQITKNNNERINYERGYTFKNNYNEEYNNEEARKEIYAKFHGFVKEIKKDMSGKKDDDIKAYTYTQNNNSLGTELEKINNVEFLEDKNLKYILKDLTETFCQSQFKNQNFKISLKPDDNIFVDSEKCEDKFHTIECFNDYNTSKTDGVDSNKEKQGIQIVIETDKKNNNVKSIFFRIGVFVPEENNDKKKDINDNNNISNNVNSSKSEKFLLTEGSEFQMHVLSRLFMFKNGSFVPSKQEQNYNVKRTVLLKGSGIIANKKCTKYNDKDINKEQETQKSLKKADSSTDEKIIYKRLKVYDSSLEDFKKDNYEEIDGEKLKFQFTYFDDNSKVEQPQKDTGREGGCLSCFSQCCGGNKVKELNEANLQDDKHNNEVNELNISEGNKEDNNIEEIEQNIDNHINNSVNENKNLIDNLRNNTEEGNLSNNEYQIINNDDKIIEENKQNHTIEEEHNSFNTSNREQQNLIKTYKNSDESNNSNHDQNDSDLQNIPENSMYIDLNNKQNINNYNIHNNNNNKINNMNIDNEFLRKNHYKQNNFLNEEENNINCYDNDKKSINLKNSQYYNINDNVVKKEIQPKMYITKLVVTNEVLNAKNNNIQQEKSGHLDNKFLNNSTIDKENLSKIGEKKENQI